MGKLVLFFLVVPCLAFGQAVGDYRSAAAGPSNWSTVASWERFNGAAWVAAPSSPVTADGVITIQAGHTIQIQAASSITADQIVIDGTLRVLDNGSLTVSGAGAGSAITVNSGGILEKQATNPGPGTISGTTTTNTVFNSGSFYIHNFTNLSGNPVAATWNLGSEMQITGYTGGITIAGANWGGNFATVRYNCPNQANGTVNFAGLLTTIQEDLRVEATTTAGTGRFIFNSTGTSTTAIGGNLDISGPSRVWLSIGGSATVNVTGNFSFNPTIASTSQLSGGAGVVNLTIGGSATFTSNFFTMASVAGGTANLTINNGNSLNLNGGTFVVSSAASTGTVTINGGDFLYAGGNLTYATTGTGSINVNSGDFTMTSSGTMNFASGAGAGTLTLAGGNFSATSGSISETSTGSGTIAFTTTSSSTIDAAPSRFTTGAIGLTVNKPSGSLQIINNDLTIAGALTMTDGSLDLNGRILTLGGNIGPNNWTSSSFTTTAASSLIIQGAGTLPTTNMAIQNGSSFTTFTLNRTATTLNSSGNISVGTLNLTAGTLTHTGTLTMNNLGAINVSAGAMTNAPAAAGVYDVSYSNAAVLNSGNELPTPPSAVLRNLSKSAAGVLTLTKSIDINGNLAVTAGTLTSFLNGTITLAGDFTGAGTFTNNGGTMIFSGAGTQTLSGASRTFNSVTVNSGATIASALGQTINGTFNNNGTVNFTAGTLTLGGTSVSVLANPSSTTVSALTLNTTTGATLTANSALTISGVLTINAGASITAGASSTVTKGAGNFVGTGSYVSSGTTTFTGASTLSGAGQKTFSNLVVNATVTPNAAYTVNGNISGSGTLAAGTNTATFAGTTLISGTGAKNFFDVLINNGTAVTYSTDIAVSGATLNVVGPGGSLATDIITSPAIITLTSVAVSGTGTKDFTNVTIGTGASTIANAYTVRGNLVMTGSLVSAGIPTFAGATLVSGVGALTFSSDVIINGTSSLTLSAGTIRVNGNISNSGTVNPGTGTLQFGGTTVVTNTGTLNLNNVSFAGAANTMTAPATTLGIAGNFTSSGVFNNGGGTILFNGVATQTLSASEVYNNVTVNPAAIVTSALSQTINGNLDNNGSFSITGAATNSLLFAGLASTLSGSGNTTTLDLTVASPNSLNVTSTGNLTLNDDLLSTGNFTFTSTGTIIFGGAASAISGASTKIFRNMSVTGGMTPGVAYSFSGIGTLDVGGTLTAGAGAVTFDGTTTISGAGSINFDVTTISGTGTLNVPANTNLTFQDNFTNNGTYTQPAGTGTITFGATGAAKSILGTNPIVINNLVISNNGAAVDVTNSSSGGVSIRGLVTINATSVLDADGAGTSPFTLLSTADNPTSDGSIGPLLTGANITGNITVQRYVSSENRIYRYIAAPVFGATVAQLKSAIPVTGTFTDPSDGLSTPPCSGCNTTSPSLFSFDETTPATYIAFPASGLASASTFVNGRGYSAFFRHTGLGAVGIVTINFTGTHPSNAGVALPVSPSPAPTAGFSLVGNPYPSPIIWNNGAGWTKTNIADNIVVRDNATGLHQTYSAAAGTGIIAAGQSFWVQSSAAGASLQINENAKTATQGNFYKVEDQIRDEVEILLTKGTTGNTDKALIAIQPNALLSYESFDAFKFNNNIDNGSSITEVQDISTLSSDAKVLAVNAVPSVTCGQTFSVKVTNFINVGETIVNYTLNLNPTGSLKALTWTLHDNYTNSDTDLSTNPSYSFQVDNSITASKATNRFTLTATSATAILPNLPLTSSGQVCESSATSVTVAGSQLNMMYGVEVNGMYYPNVAQGTGSDLNIPLQSEWLNATSNTIRVKVNSGCDAQFLTATTQIAKENLYTAVPTSAQSCVKGSVTLTASGAPATTNYNWYDTQNASTPVATGSQFVTPVLSDTTTYYVAAFNSQGCEGARASVTAYISDLSGQVSLVPSATVVCRNNTITFNASSDLPGTFKWYETATSTDVLSTSSEFTTPALSKTKKYYISFVNNNGCEGDRIEAIAQISNFSPVLGADNGMGTKTICAQGSYTFKANGAPLNSEYYWFDTVDSPTPIADGDEFVTSPLAASRSYFLAAKNELGCYTDRYEIVAAVDQTNPSEGIVSAGNNACMNGNAVINLSGGTANATYNWYETANSTDRINEGAQFTAVNITASKSWFVSAVNPNGCEGSRVEVKVEVSNFNPELKDDNGDNLVCVQGSHTFKASGAPPSASYVWFDSKDSLTPLAETSEFTTPQLSGARSYYLAARDEFGCYSGRSEFVAAIENPSLNISAISEGMICNSSKANISVSDEAADASYNWYDAKTSTKPIYSGKLLTTESLTGSKSYFVSAVSASGCEGSRIEVDVEVVASGDPKIIQISDQELESNYQEGNQWYLNGVLLEGEDKQRLSISEAGMYELKVLVEGCASAAPGFDLVTGFDDVSRTIKVYPNPASEVLSIRFVGNEEVKVHFIDEKGSIVTPIQLKSSGILQEGELDVHSFSKGLYFIRIFSESKSITHKVIIK